MCKIDKNKEKQEVIVTPEMVIAALVEAENWSSFESKPGEGAMKAVIYAALAASASQASA